MKTLLNYITESTGGELLDEFAGMFRPALFKQYKKLFTFTDNKVTGINEKQFLKLLGVDFSKPNPYVNHNTEKQDGGMYVDEYRGWYWLSWKVGKFLTPSGPNIPTGFAIGINPKGKTLNEIVNVLGANYFLNHPEEKVKSTRRVDCFVYKNIMKFISIICSLDKVNERVKTMINDTLKELDEGKFTKELERLNKEMVKNDLKSTLSDSRV